MKKHTTSLTQCVTLSGALAVLAFGLGAGSGSAGATHLRALQSGTVYSASVRSSEAATIGLGSDTKSTRVQRAGDATLRRTGVSTQPSRTTGRFHLPASSQSLPTGSSTAPASGPNSPAPQAQGVDLLSTSPNTHRLGTGATLITSPARLQMAANDRYSAPQAKPATGGVTSVAQMSTSARLTTASTASPDRVMLLSSLNLEHVLDRQVLSPATLAGVARVASSGQNLDVTLQRRPDATGLKLANALASSTQSPQDGSASSTPTPSATGAGSAQPSPAPSGSSNATATVVNMPGGNARMCYITGYTATGSLTATGTVPRWGVVAVDSSVIPLGSTVYIQGLGYFPCRGHRRRRRGEPHRRLRELGGRGISTDRLPARELRAASTLAFPAGQAVSAHDQRDTRQLHWRVSRLSQMPCVRNLHFAGQ